MRVLTRIEEIRSACMRARRAVGENSTLALVPTMGAIHEGHLSLVAAASRECGVVVVSIFVNPLQFGPTEDFSKYPRTFDEDCRKLEEAGVDLLFAPQLSEMYPPGATTFVEVAGISGRLDGASRPGHFQGVATVVTKLFNIVAPDLAYFGQKDAAQVAVLQVMVRDLNVPVHLVVCPTIREADGLALSSRNRYLSADQRIHALALSRALQAVARGIEEGETRAVALRQRMETIIAGTPGVRLDYAEIVRPDTLESIDSITGEALVAIAAWVGEVRLIDNLRVGQRLSQALPDKGRGWNVRA